MQITDNTGVLNPPERETVLLVDDQPLNLELLKCYLESDYDVVTATSASEAFEYCERTTPDVILMDVRMPEIDGLQACKQLKKTPSTKNVPVVFVTAMTAENDQQECWDAGGDDYIPKPVHRANLRNRVRAQLKNKVKTTDSAVVQDAIPEMPDNTSLREYLDFQTKISFNNKQELSVMMVGADHHADYLLLYGERKFEAVMLRLSEVIEESLTNDVQRVFRHSRSRYCVVLPEIDRSEAWGMGSRVINTMRQAKIQHPAANSGYMSFSIGLSSLIDSGFDQHNLVSLARRNLSNAEHIGGNHIVGWSPTGIEYL